MTRYDFETRLLVIALAAVIVGAVLLLLGVLP